MKQRNTLVLLLILAVIVTILVLVVNPPERKESEEAAEPGLFADLDLDRLSRVVVNTTRKNSTLRREGERWVVEEYDDFPADLTALKEAITALREMDLGDVVSENREKQGTFQVDQSGIEVLLSGAGEDELLAHFFLGKPGHDYRSIYFRQADSDQVYLVDQQLRGRFKAQPAALQLCPGRSERSAAGRRRERRPALPADGRPGRLGRGR